MGEQDTNREFGNIFREKLSNFEASPPEAAWSHIAAQIQTTNKPYPFSIVSKVVIAGMVLFLVADMHKITDKNAVQQKDLTARNDLHIAADTQQLLKTALIPIQEKTTDNKHITDGNYATSGLVQTLKRKYLPNKYDQKNSLKEPLEIYSGKQLKKEEITLKEKVQTMSQNDSVPTQKRRKLPGDDYLAKITSNGADEKSTTQKQKRKNLLQTNVLNKPSKASVKQKPVPPYLQKIDIHIYVRMLYAQSLSVFNKKDSLLALPTSAQEQVFDEAYHDGFSVFFQASPLYTYNRLLVNNQDDIIVFDHSDTHNLSSQNIGFSVGLGVEKQFKIKRQRGRAKLPWKWYAALHYTNIAKQNYLNMQGTAPDTYEINPSGANGFMATPIYVRKDYRIASRHTLLGTQFGLKYLIRQRKVAHRIRLGITMNLLLSTQQEDSLIFVDAAETSDILQNDNLVNPSTSSLHGGISLGYHLSQSISNSISLYVEPNLNYYFTSFFDNKISVVGAKPYTVGINFGLMWRWPEKRKTKYKK